MVVKYLLTILVFLSVFSCEKSNTESVLKNPPVSEALNSGLKDFAAFPIGVATKSADLDKYPLLEPIIKKEYNRLTIANFQMWGTQPQQDAFNFAYVDRMLKLAEDNKMQKWGHVLMWSEYGIYCDWVKNFQYARIVTGKQIGRAHV